jgi:hypothetical protein
MCRYRPPLQGRECWCLRHGCRRCNAHLNRVQSCPLVQVVEVGFRLAALLAKIRFCEVATYGLCRLGGLGDTRIAVGKRIIVRRQDQAQLGVFAVQCLGHFQQVARVHCARYGMAGGLMDAGPGGKALAHDQHALGLADAKVAALDAPARLKALVPLRADGLQAVQGG